MNRKRQVTLATCLLSGSLLGVAAMFYLVAVFPRTEELWKDQQRQLGVTEMLMTRVSNMAKVLGLPILGLLFLAIAAAAIWLVICIQANRRNAANNPSQPVAAKRGPG